MLIHLTHDLLGVDPMSGLKLHTILLANEKWQRRDRLGQ
jgi:hypothetical protein